jgi:hypothetical protein
MYGSGANGISGTSLGSGSHFKKNICACALPPRNIFKNFYRLVLPSRVTRLGEFSPIGQLFAVVKFLKNTKGAQKFGTKKSMD